MDRKDPSSSAVGLKIKKEALKIKSQYSEENGRHKSLPRPTPPFSKKQSIDSGADSSRSRNGKFKTQNEETPYQVYENVKSRTLNSSSQ